MDKLSKKEKTLQLAFVNKKDFKLLDKNVWDLGILLKMKTKKTNLMMKFHIKIMNYHFLKKLMAIKDM